MKRLVTKFGGTSVMDAERIRQAASIICGLKGEGNEITELEKAIELLRQNLRKFK